MVQLPNSYDLAKVIYEESKFWIAVGSAFWFMFRGYDWLRTIKTNDLHHIQMGVTDLTTGVNNLRSDLKEGFDGQTEKIVRELSELRSDIRMALVPQRAAAARARRRKAKK